MIVAGTASPTASRPWPTSPPAALAAIVFGAVLLRVVFFVGLVSGDPQDDGIYYGNAFGIYQDGLRYLDRYRDLPADFLANPIDQFHVRPMVTWPIAGLFTLFGPGEVTAALWGFACSIASVVVVYRLGVVLHSRAVGLLAALLCAVYPLEVINGTRILSDVQVGLFFSLGLLLLIEASRRSSLVLSCLSGVAAGAAYLSNGRGLIVLAALAASAIALALKGRARWQVAAGVAAGFTAVFAVEALVYFVRTGDPLLSLRIQSGASLFKYLHEPVSSVRLGWIDVRFTNGQPLELVRTVFSGSPRGVDQFGLFFWLFLAAAAYALVRRRLAPLALLAIGLFLYLDFGPIRLEWSTTPIDLRYFMVFKQERFALLLTAPSIVLAASLVAAIGRKSRVLAALVLIVVAATSGVAIARTRAVYRGGLADLRAATTHVLAHPDRRYLGDHWAVEHVRIFSRHRAGNVQVLDARATPADPSGACLMLGGSRGVELLADYVTATLPPFARDVLVTGAAPADWRLVMLVDGPRSDFRRWDFRIYCVPEPAAAQ
jgi:hypothetical protein